MESNQLKTEILFDHSGFSVVNIDGVVGIRMKKLSVAVLPYKTDNNGMVKEIGVLQEYNPLRPNNSADTLITGTIEYEDDSLLYTARRELKEEGGFDVKEDENDRWLFLGGIFPYKDSDRLVPVFACDVSRLEQGKASGDGSPQEEKSKLVMLDVSKGIASDDGLLLSAFLRLFNFMYAKTLDHV
jgi:8-oxo-dGTP pyrophosphatase MutT (NUDIX family)